MLSFLKLSGNFQDVQNRTTCILSLKEIKCITHYLGQTIIIPANFIFDQFCYLEYIFFNNTKQFVFSTAKQIWIATTIHERERKTEGENTVKTDKRNVRSI